jgi:hypothetical protein
MEFRVEGDARIKSGHDGSDPNIGIRILEDKEIENQRDHDRVNNQAHEYETVEQLFLRSLHEEKAISVD